MNKEQIVVNLAQVRIRMPIPRQRSKAHGTIKGLRGYDRQHNKRICRKEAIESAF